jgi:hypothetical protein
MGWGVGEVIIKDNRIIIPLIALRRSMLGGLPAGMVMSYP